MHICIELPISICLLSSYAQERRSLKPTSTSCKNMFVCVCGNRLFLCLLYDISYRFHTNVLFGRESFKKNMLGRVLPKCYEFMCSHCFLDNVNIPLLIFHCKYYYFAKIFMIFHRFYLFFIHFCRFQWFRNIWFDVHRFVQILSISCDDYRPLRLSIAFNEYLVISQNNCWYQ